MIHKKMEMEKNNRREALSAIILSFYTIYLMGSEPTTCAAEHTTIYYHMLFIESCYGLHYRTFISVDPAASCIVQSSHRIQQLSARSSAYTASAD